MKIIYLEGVSFWSTPRETLQYSCWLLWGEDHNQQKNGDGHPTMRTRPDELLVLPHAVPRDTARRWWGDAGPSSGQAAQKTHRMAPCWPWRQPAPRPVLFTSVAVAHVWGDLLPATFLNSQTSRAWAFWLRNILSSCGLLLISGLSGLRLHLGN